MSLFAGIVPGMICLVCLFYGLLHSWLNGFAELLRFGDRQFYLVNLSVLIFRQFVGFWGISMNSKKSILLGQQNNRYLSKAQQRRSNVQWASMELQLLRTAKRPHRWSELTFAVTVIAIVAVLGVFALYLMILTKKQTLVLLWLVIWPRKLLIPPRDAVAPRSPKMPALSAFTVGLSTFNVSHHYEAKNSSGD